MDPELRSTLVKVAAPLVGIVVVLLVSKKRGLSLRDDVGLRAPEPAAAAIWMASWIAWMVASELASSALGIAQASPWSQRDPAIVALRIAAIGLLGPIAEELVMRGALFGRLRRTALGPWGAILVTAAVWAPLHYRYGWETVGLIFLDGVIFGAARHYGRSTYLPIGMHVLGNLVSIYQSLHASGLL